MRCICILKNNVLKLDEKYVDEFCHIRMELFEELGEISGIKDISKLKMATEKYYLSHINKDLISFGIFQNEILVSTGSLCLFNRIPYEKNLSGLEGYILNIYTSPQFRNRGFANQILDEIVEYARKYEIKRLWLNYSDNAEKLYSKKGFVKKENGMELFLFNQI